MERLECLQKYVKTKKFDILIATYQSVKSAENVLKKFNWQSLIVDEAHSIKNDETQLAISLRQYRARFILLMTGTPLSNNLRELWCLLNFILPHLFSDDTLFQRIEESANDNGMNDEEKIKFQG